MKKKVALVDCRICEKSVDTLKALGFCVFRMPPFSSLSPSVESHPDMLTFIADGKLITHEDYYNENINLFSKIEEAANISVVTTNEEIGKEYPCDILFNAFLHDGHIFGRLNAISHCIREFEGKGYTLHNVKQGYAACSCAEAGDGVITADKTLYRAFCECGIDALLIENGDIALPFHDYGFIGGASGYSDGVLYLNGDIETHRNKDAIKNFVTDKNCASVSLCDGPLVDVGKIVFI